MLAIARFSSKPPQLRKASKSWHVTDFFGMTVCGLAYFSVVHSSRPPCLCGRIIWIDAGRSEKYAGCWHSMRFLKRVDAVLSIALHCPCLLAAPHRLVERSRWYRGGKPLFALTGEVQFCLIGLLAPHRPVRKLRRICNYLLCTMSGFKRRLQENCIGDRYSSIRRLGKDGGGHVYLSTYTYEP